jgi:hypothetical protein
MPDFEPVLPPWGQKPRRGGKRPGAGAPRGNLNALKTGKRSARITRGLLVLALIPEVAEALRNMRKMNGPDYRKQLNEALLAAHRAAELDPGLKQSIATLLLRRYNEALTQTQSGSTKNEEVSEQSNNQTATSGPLSLAEGEG